MDPGPISIILLSPVYFPRTVYFTRILYCFPLDTLITFVSSKPVRLTTSSQVGNKVFVCVCAGSALLLAEDESTSIVNGALVGVLLSQSASPSVVIISPLQDRHTLVSKLRENLLLHSSYLPLGVPNGLVIHHAQGLTAPTSTTRHQLFSGVIHRVAKLTSNGKYSTASAYNLQFFGLIESSLYKLIWKAWATPKAKHHAWLALQNRLLTADRLQRRGWENCGLSPLCKQTEETNNHLFVHCRFTIRVWELLKD
jgi:hypothetical protein